MNWSTSKSSDANVRVTVFTCRALLRDIRQRLTMREGFSIATLNLDHVVKLRHDPSFREAYTRHTHITADGNPIVWLSRLAGQSDVTLVPGSELIEPVAAVAAECGVKVALVGASEASLTAAAVTLQRKYPELDVVLKWPPTMGFDPVGSESDDIIAAIKASGAGVVFLALGAPKQEIFATHAQTALPKVGFLSIGAGLDFISGSQQRAPRWVRAIAAEWLWRLFGNPRRLLGRYVACLGVLPGLFLSALATRWGRPLP